MTNSLTTIAALPRMGAGFASAQKADVLPACTSDKKLALDERVALSILGLMGWVPVVDGVDHGAEQIWSSESFDLVTACTAEEALASAQKILARGFAEACQEDGGITWSTDRIEVEASSSLLSVMKGQP